MSRIKRSAASRDEIDGPATPRLVVDTEKVRFVEYGDTYLDERVAVFLEPVISCGHLHDDVIAITGGDR